MIPNNITTYNVQFLQLRFLYYEILAVLLLMYFYIWIIICFMNNSKVM